MCGRHEVVAYMAKCSGHRGSSCVELWIRLVPKESLHVGVMKPVMYILSRVIVLIFLNNRTLLYSSFNHLLLQVMGPKRCWKRI